MNDVADGSTGVSRLGNPPGNSSIDLPDDERKQLAGTGVVYIAERWEVLEPGPRFDGHWEARRHGSPIFVEHGPGWEDPNDAVAWGRDRAPRIVVRTGSGPDVRHFTAGDVDLDSDQDYPSGYPKWPPSDWVR
jgi:hypothetical protein